MLGSVHDSGDLAAGTSSGEVPSIVKDGIDFDDQLIVRSARIMNPNYHF